MTSSVHFVNLKEKRLVLANHAYQRRGVLKSHETFECLRYLLTLFEKCKANVHQILNSFPPSHTEVSSFVFSSGIVNEFEKIRTQAGVASNFPSANISFFLSEAFEKTCKKEKISGPLYLSCRH